MHSSEENRSEHSDLACKGPKPPASRRGPVVVGARHSCPPQINILHVHQEAYPWKVCKRVVIPQRTLTNGTRSERGCFKVVLGTARSSPVKRSSLVNLPSWWPEATSAQTSSRRRKRTWLREAAPRRHLGMSLPRPLRDARGPRPRWVFAHGGCPTGHSQLIAWSRATRPVPIRRGCRVSGSALQQTWELSVPLAARGKDHCCQAKERRVRTRARRACHWPGERG